jgi:hypothetical protein
VSETPAEPLLIEYATRVADEIPSSVSLKFDSMSKAKFENNNSNTFKNVDHPSNGLSINLGPSPTDYLGVPKRLQADEVQSSLASTYETSVNIFG